LKFEIAQPMEYETAQHQQPPHLILDSSQTDIRITILILTACSANTSNSIQADWI